MIIRKYKYKSLVVVILLTHIPIFGQSADDILLSKSLSLIVNY